jgi:hypothetical protein
LDGGDLGGLDGLFVEDFVDHDPLGGHPSGLAGMRLGLQALAEQCEAVRFHLEDCFAAGERVAYRLFGTWTVPPALVFQRDLAPPAPVSLSSTGIFRCRAGRLAERWGPWTLTVDGQPASLEAPGRSGARAGVAR